MTRSPESRDLPNGFVWVPEYPIIATGSGPLDGMTVAIKEIIAVKGAPHNDGSSRLGPVASVDAPVVEALRRSGAQIVGTTASSELAYGVLDAEHHPVTNPRSAGYFVGGSTAGGAAAVAAGAVELAVGTDTGGSVRIPAAWTQIFGFKPTWGSVSTEEVIPLAWSLDHIGFMARTAKTIAAALQAVADLPTGGSPGPWRVGVVTLDRCVPLEHGAADGVRLGAQALRELGHQVLSVDCGPWTNPTPTHEVILWAEMAAAHKDRPGLSAPIRETIEHGGAIPATEYILANRIRESLRQLADDLFDRCDYLLLPTVPCGALRRGQRSVHLGTQHWDPTSAAVRLTSVANLLGLPALSIPTAIGCGNAIQLIGRTRDDHVLLQLGDTLSAEMRAAPS